MNKEIQVILNILKSYDNVIPDELISKIFENLKFVYRTPSYTEFVLHKNIHITNYQKIYEINNEFYEFSFSFDMPTLLTIFFEIKETTTIKFNKIKEKKEVIEYINNLLEKYYKDLEYYSDKKFFSDKIKHLEQFIK